MKHRLIADLNSAEFQHGSCAGWSQRRGRNRRDAFTLVEIIGVVAVIAILAAVLTPRVVEVIARSRVSGTAQSLGSLQSAVTGYIVVSNSLPQRLGYEVSNTATPGGRFDTDLLRSGLVERLFASPIGSQLAQSSAGTGCTPGVPQTTTALLLRPHIRSAPGGAASLTPVAVAITEVNFDLDRNGSGDFPSTAMIAFAYIPQVRVVDALGLNRIIDGETLTAGVEDTAGRCISSAVGTNNTVTVYVYLGQL